ncbi:BamA/TamA family outer membrane protein [Fischerella thermalis]|uniref:BamA/TamA family outer membrane protein n=1 Tax=Fischerella thermalis TaxID=372787 RepID=UPI0019FB1762|nr:BamA/TamA family outer membrane protein [Fischerella thermalis]MBF1991759.1 BamA/TamA family outer membrane protein [Fischerella thermalis M58_A2018_009]MBF2062056.1 BamA/TamA family outer membrane protein [Fischerella thermalis M66_A2018_004]MBF2069441.1 BamA/TamA family outer membrane protein [Fischerella thermalis M48_A2018_028]
MRLSPVLMTMVAIATPLGGSLHANAQTANNSKKTADVVVPTTNQDQEVVAGLPTTDTTQEVTIPTFTIPNTTQTVQDTTSTASPEQEVFEVFSAKETTLELTRLTNNQSKNIQLSPKTKPTTLRTQTTNQQVSVSTPGASALKTTPQTTTSTTPKTAQNSPTIIPQNTQPPNNQKPPSQNQQSPTNQPPTNNQQQPTTEAEPRVLVSEVVIRTETGQPLPAEQENQVYGVIRTQPGRTTTRSQLQEDINSVFATGFFSNVQAVPEDTPLGVRVTFLVQLNPTLSQVRIDANPGTNVPSVLPPNTVNQIFSNQYGRILNLRELQEGIKQLLKVYQDQGYVLAQVVGSPQVSPDGVVTLTVAEGVVEDISVQYRNKEGQETDKDGKPIRGRTQPYIVTREIQLKPGQVFNRNIIQRDLQRVYGLGLFEDVNVSLNPGTNPSQVDVQVNVVERNSGSIAAGAGISSASGLFGTISYQEQNLNGRNQKLGAELEVGQRELLFDVRFTDPWIAGDPYRTSYTANLFRSRSISLIFEGKDDNIETFQPGEDNGDTPRILRLGGGINFSRPLSKNPYERAEWTASAGIRYQRVSTRDSDGNIREEGTIFENDQPTKIIELTESGTGQDDLLTLQLAAVRDKRDNALQPTRGSFFRLGLEQSVPVGLGNIFMSKVRGSYSYYLPVRFTNFTKGAQTIAFNVQGGTILGDVPPYEAFTLGGSNSVRGYEEGALASSSSFLQATVEYRFPVFSVVSGALFFDAATDLGTETEAGDLLDKSGSGYGYGLGVRVQSPLGPIRIDYGFNDQGDSRINFGIGERF